MKIIISPAKKMNVNNDDILPSSTPFNMDKTSLLCENLKKKSYDDLKKLLCCNDKIAELNYERYRTMDLSKNLSPAILSYDGIQYKYMAPDSFTYDEFDYINEHLRILSGFYGILKPFDGIVPYRLEMQAKLNIGNSKNLYDFWGNSIYEKLVENSKIILNLASKEYSCAIEKYLSKDVKFVTCIFGTLKDSKIVVRATEAKMARGLMVSYMAQNNISNLEDIKLFNERSFKYSYEHSTEDKFVFLNNI